MIAHPAILAPDGVTHVAATHAEAKLALFAAGHRDGEVGFVTDTGRFLARRDAADHAIACRQVYRLSAPPYLFEDDLK